LIFYYQKSQENGNFRAKKPYKMVLFFLKVRFQRFSRCNNAMRITKRYALSYAKLFPFSIKIYFYYKHKIIEKLVIEINWLLITD